MQKTDEIISILSLIDNELKSIGTAKWYEIVKRIKIRKRKKQIIKASILKAFSEGYTVGKNEFLDTLVLIEKKAEAIINLSTKNEKLLQTNYQSSIDNVEEGWRKRCATCRKAVDQERMRFVRLQQELQESIDKFNLIYSQLIKFISSMDITHSSLLNHVARIENSKKSLETIKENAEVFVETNKKLLQASINKED